MKNCEVGLPNHYIYRKRRRIGDQVWPDWSCSLLKFNFLLSEVGATVGSFMVIYSDLPKKGHSDYCIEKRMAGHQRWEESVYHYKIQVTEYDDNSEAVISGYILKDIDRPVVKCENPSSSLSKWKAGVAINWNGKHCRRSSFSGED